VVAAGVRHHTAGADVVREPADRVGGATDLERADGLQLLGFEPQWAVFLGPKAWQQRGSDDRVADARGRGFDVVDRGDSHVVSMHCPQWTVLVLTIGQPEEWVSRRRRWEQWE
jgi:hypothetical protein